MSNRAVWTCRSSRFRTRCEPVHLPDLWDEVGCLACRGGIHVTDRRHASDDVNVPGLEEVVDETDPGIREKADELLEGLLGAEVANLNDIPSSVANAEDAGAREETESNTAPEKEATGRWSCRFCHSERRRPDGVGTHHVTCPDSQQYRTDTHHRPDIDLPLDEVLCRPRAPEVMARYRAPPWSLFFVSNALSGFCDPPPDRRR